MRNETKQIVQEYEVWIADDGTEFEDKESCFRYELDCQENAMRIQSLGASIPPPGITDFNPKNIARWYLLKNEDDASVLSMYYDTFIKCDQFPQAVCLEVDHDFNYYDCYAHTLNNMVDGINEIFEKFGYKVNLERIENNEN